MNSLIQLVRWVPLVPPLIMVGGDTRAGSVMDGAACEIWGDNGDI
jgi:hypothetical protein